MLHRGHCLPWLRSLAPASVDVVITDPPYPEIDRDYGRLSEADWHTLMNAVVAECRRVLKPTGSAVFVLQPNSERVGRMRPWLWQFMAKWAAEWNMPQDVWWWNYTAMPGDRAGLLKASVKACVWLGAHDCYRSVADVLVPLSDYAKAERCAPDTREERPSGHGINRRRAAVGAMARGGAIPPNLLPIANSSGRDAGGDEGHGAATPYALCQWWVRYLTKPGDLVVDPFAGSGTVGMAALREGRRFAGAEQHAPYWPICERRLCEADRQLSLAEVAS